MPVDSRAGETWHEGHSHNDKGELKGVIFDIQRFSVHDGPGIRTTVFLKGCPLRCLWCHNPESQSPVPEIMFFGSKCIGCGRCQEVCPRDAIMMDSVSRVNRELCDNCGICADSCPSGALVLSGRVVSVSDVMVEVDQDVLFYDTSGGGVTLSGGEPTMQLDFAVALAAACKAKGYHVAIDTCGFVAREEFVRLLRQADLLLFDVKHIDSEEHRRLTGVDNGLILDNLCEAARRGVDLIVRVPVIPGCNDTKRNVQGITEFVMRLARLRENIKGIELIPYHRLGERKYQALGRCYPLAGIAPPDHAAFENLRQMVTMPDWDDVGSIGKIDTSRE